MRNYLTILIAAIVPVSCTTVKSEYDVWNLSPVNLNEVKERCLTAMEKERPSVNDFEGFDIFQYDIPGPESDYIIPDTFKVSQPELQGAVDRYNSYMVMHNIWSQYEIFVRYSDYNYMDEFVNIMNNIMGFSTDSLKDDTVRTTIEYAKIELCKDIGAVAFGTREENPARYIKELERYLETKPLFTPRNQKIERKVIRDQLAWSIEPDSAYIHSLNAVTDKDTLVNLFFEEICNAPTYQQQCAVALLSVGKAPGEVVLPVMRELLSSGRYSQYEFIMWLGWRSAVQYFFFGPSRDAQIADELYNIYKNKAFLATLRYCNIHPGDETALMILEMFCSTGNVVRNGNYDFGNDAVTDFEMVFNR